MRKNKDQKWKLMKTNLILKHTVDSPRRVQLRQESLFIIIGIRRTLETGNEVG